MANEFKIRKGLTVAGSGSTILDIQGSQGQLFSVVDSLSGSLFAVKDISGYSILDVDSSKTVSLTGPLYMSKIPGNSTYNALVMTGSGGKIFEVVGRVDQASMALKTNNPGFTYGLEITSSYSNTIRSQAYSNLNLIQYGTLFISQSANPIDVPILLQVSDRSQNNYLTVQSYYSSSALSLTTINNVLALPPISSLPTVAPTGSIATSGSGVNCKPYFWNGSTWTSMI